MNKLSKGAVAAGVGVALLLGGSGTLALWNDSVSAQGDAIATGEMTIRQANEQWQGGAPTLWVPGDQHVYTTDITITASGDNLVAALDVNTDSVSGDEGLLRSLKYDLQLDSIDASGVTVTPGPDGTYTIIPAPPAGGTVNAKATLTVSLPESVDGTTAQDAHADLANLNLSLTQQR